jgi:hypothetical protein
MSALRKKGVCQQKRNLINYVKIRRTRFDSSQIRGLNQLASVFPLSAELVYVVSQRAWC